MKKLILFFSLIFVLTQTSCGPAAENKEVMHNRAKVVHDSLAKSIKDALAEVEQGPNAVVVKDTTKKNPQ